MANRDRPMLGVSITPREIQVVRTSGVWPNVRVLDADAVAMPVGTMEGDLIVSPRVAAAALVEMLGRLSITTRDAVIGLPARGLTTRVLEIPQAPDNEIAGLIAGEMEHYHILREGDGVFDYAPMRGAQQADNANLAILLMAADDRLLNGYREFAAQAGLQLIALEPVPLAMYRVAYVRAAAEPLTACLCIS